MQLAFWTPSDTVGCRIYTSSDGGAPSVNKGSYIEECPSNQPVEELGKEEPREYGGIQPPRARATMLTKAH